MRRLVLVAAFVALGGALLPVVAFPAAGGKDLPFSASMSGQGTVDLATGQAHNLLTANATHFGRSTLEEFSQIIPTGPGTFLSVGHLTLTAANGDQMTGTATGPGTTVDGVHFTFSLHAVFADGTGRFAGSSLTYDVTVHSTTVSVAGTVATSALDATAAGSFSH
jgi:hypothetical protein